MRVMSGSWDGEKVILRDQVLEVRNVDGRLHIARKSRHHDEWDPSTTRIARAQALALTQAISPSMTKTVSAYAGTISADTGHLSE
jgi:hypothetical protein